MMFTRRLLPRLHNKAVVRLRRRVCLRSFYFSIITTSLILAKLLHIYVHFKSLPTAELIIWSPTFFLQDIIVILISRILSYQYSKILPQIITSITISITSLLLLCMVAADFTFYLLAGAEISWCRAQKFVLDEAGVRFLSYGLPAGSFVLSAILTISFAIALWLYNSSGKVIQCLLQPRYILGYSPVQLRLPFAKTSTYIYGVSSHAKDKDLSGDYRTRKAISDIVSRASICIVATSILCLQLLRPHRYLYVYLSWTLPLLPLICPGTSGNNVVAGLTGGYFVKNNCKTHIPIPNFDWLPTDKTAGFEDWYKNSYDNQSRGYKPEEECLHVSNLENSLLEPLQDVFNKDKVKVKHIILIKLESTRQDVFPLKNNTFLWTRIAESYESKKLPPHIESALHNLTPIAAHLTANDNEHESKHQDQKGRGGIVASDAYTTSTYTLKSLTGTLCGIMPFAADFNVEYRNHIYRPCVAHILEAFNRKTAVEENSDNFVSWPWKSTWMQSVTDNYDKQNLLMDALGYDNIISRETLINPESKHFPPKQIDSNYFGLPENELKPYLRDLITDAEKSKRRLFVTHLTSSTHHPWSLPEDYPLQQYMGYTGYGISRKINRYLNTQSFVDKWLGEILEVLEETGVAKETLLILVGDHGTSLPNDGGNTAYDNPHVGNFHVPLVFSHPAIPSIQIKGRINAMQILPTMLDLLISSTSLDENIKKVAADLLPLYEGQSLLRELVDTTNDGRRLWQLTVMNSGGSYIGIRSANESYRLVVPLTKDLGWRFTDLSTDPQENDPVISFEFFDFIELVRIRTGVQAVEWLNDAVAYTSSWVSENRMLWESR